MSSKKKYVYSVPLEIIHYVYTFLDIRTVFSKKLNPFIYTFECFTLSNETLQYSFRDFFLKKRREVCKIPLSNE